jgi:hypothetical protein
MTGRLVPPVPILNPKTEDAGSWLGPRPDERLRVCKQGNPLKIPLSRIMWPNMRIVARNDVYT